LIKKDKAVEICLQSYTNAASAQCAVLLAEIMASVTGQFDESKTESVFADALSKWGKDAKLLNAVATLRIAQERYVEAVGLFEQADSLSPNQIGTLNNLAICLAEIPMRGQDALDRINKALRAYKRIPELLDTLAIVQTKLGQYANAKTTLVEAIESSDDPRFQMRLAEVQLKLSDSEGASKTWKAIDLSKLEAMSLLPPEKRTLQALKASLGAKP
jgi:Flp pilus assembly protein TadD